MNKEHFRLIVGSSVIIVHFACLIIIMYFQNDYLDQSSRVSMALLFMPVTASYVCAIIKSAIDRSGDKDICTYVNLNYAVIIGLFTVGALVGLLWSVISLEGAQDADRQTILIYETAFGAGFGIICADLFGRAGRT